MNTDFQKIIIDALKIASQDKAQEFQTYQAIRRFKQCGQISPFKPFSVQLQTHSFCNGRCVFCPYPEMKKKLPQGRMEKELIHKIADEISTWETPPQIILMLQNEPLMGSDFFNTLEYFKKSNPQIEVGTVTNGSLLNESMINQIVKSRLDHLTISLNAFSRDTYEKLHPGFSFEGILSSIRMLAEQKNDRLSVKLSFVDTTQNHNEKPDFIQFARKHNMGFRIIQLLNRADTLKHYNLFRISRYTWKSLKLRLIYKYFYQACNLPFQSITILYNGDVILCCNDWQRGAVVGNVNRETLERIWNGKTINFYRQQIIDKKISRD